MTELLRLSKAGVPVDIIRRRSCDELMFCSTICSAMFPHRSHSLACTHTPALLAERGVRKGAEGDAWPPPAGAAAAGGLRPGDMVVGWGRASPLCAPWPRVAVRRCARSRCVATHPKVPTTMETLCLCLGSLFPSRRVRVGVRCSAEPSLGILRARFLARRSGAMGLA